MENVNKQLLDAARELLLTVKGQKAGMFTDAERKMLSAIAAAEQAQQAEPVAWVRFCSDGCYEGPIMNSDSRMDSVRRASGAWTPLYAAQPPAVAVPDGYALVPVDPTSKMLMAADRVIWADADILGNYCNLWNAMLAASQKGGA